VGKEPADQVVMQRDIVIMGGSAQALEGVLANTSAFPVELRPGASTEATVQADQAVEDSRRAEPEASRQRDAGQDPRGRRRGGGL